jgi:hypothetical protein
LVGSFSLFSPFLDLLDFFEEALFFDFEDVERARLLPLFFDVLRSTGSD